MRHRLHHRHTDTESDPYSAANGLFFSHVGWIFYKTKYPKLPLVQKEDLCRDPVVLFQHRYFLELALLTCVALPTAVGHFRWRVGRAPVWGYNSTGNDLALLSSPFSFRTDEITKDIL